PGVLIIRGDGINFFEQHLRRELADLCGEFGATITAEDAFAHDGGGQSETGDASKQGGLAIVEESDGGGRGAEHDTRVESCAFGKGFILADDTQAGERGDDVDAIFTRSLTHIGDDGFISFEGNALLELPAEHGLGFLWRARELFEMLDED